MWNTKLISRVAETLRLGGSRIIGNPKRVAYAGALNYLGRSKKGTGLIYIVLLIGALTVLGAMTAGIVYNSRVTIKLFSKENK